MKGATWIHLKDANRIRLATSGLKNAESVMFARNLVDHTNAQITSALIDFSTASLSSSSVGTRAIPAAQTDSAGGTTARM